MAVPDPMSVDSREGLVAFVHELRGGLGGTAGTDAPDTRDAYLEALSAYIADVPGAVRNLGLVLDPDAASWQLFALLLAGASVYE